MTRPITQNDRVQALYEGAFFISEKKAELYRIDSIMSNEDTSDEEKEKELKSFLHEMTQNNPINKIMLDCFFSSCENYYPETDF